MSLKTNAEVVRAISHIHRNRTATEPKNKCLHPMSEGLGGGSGIRIHYSLNFFPIIHLSKISVSHYLACIWQTWELSFG